MLPKLEGKNLQNVHQLLFLANKYPTHTLKKLTKLFIIPIIDINNALWLAQDYDFMTINEKDGTFTIKKLPDAWEFNDDVMHLVNSLPYTFERFNREEVDFEENILANYYDGYFPQDAMVALNLLIDTKVIATYTAKNPISEQTYVFYTLYANRDKMWGVKDFRSESKKPVEKSE